MKPRQLTITPRAALQLTNPVAAPAGSAAEAVNLRETDDALAVVGLPAMTAQLPAGDILLLVDGDRLLTRSGLDVKCGGAVVATLPAEPVGVHTVGTQVAITTAGGTIWLERTDSGYHRVDPMHALPQLTLSALEVETESVGMSALTFAAPYTAWHSPLADTDLDALDRLLRSAWNSLDSRIAGSGRLGAPVLARYGVRLLDDSYLWLSQPVEIGQTTLDGLESITAIVDSDGTAVTGIPSTTLTRRSYRLGITVTRGIDPEWRARVKAVDILVTPQPALVQTGAPVNYACISDAAPGRRNLLRFALPWLSTGAVGQQLEGQPWTVVASTTDLEALDAAQWVSPAVAPTPEVVVAGVQSYVMNYALALGITLSDAEADTVGAGLRPVRAVASMTAGGRLLTVDSAGCLNVGLAGQAMVVERQQQLTGVAVRAMIAVGRPLYSNGFGRYPIVIFTDDGIYALPQTTAAGAYGEPRLVSRTVIAAGTRPVEGRRLTWFASDRGHLCALDGSEVTTVLRGVAPAQLAYDAGHDELLALLADGRLMAVMNSRRYSLRTVVTPAQLYSDPLRALIVDTDGRLLDTALEQAMHDVPVAWRTHPVAAPRRQPRQIVWPTLGDDVDLTLRLRGERGHSCHGFTVCSLHVSGNSRAPIAARLLAAPLRTLRLDIAGTAPTGTLVTPIIIS